MLDPFKLVDEFGPHKIIHICEPAQSLRAIVVVDNLALGPAIGGVRLAPDVSLEECARLARVMTLKNAAARVPHGGAKAILVASPKLDRHRKRVLLRCLANALREQGDFIAGPDMGTDEECMGWMHDEGLRVVGLPRELGGLALRELGAMGYGVLEATRTALEYCDVELAGARVVVQGFGAVGQHTARHLADAGARIVAVADSRGAIYAAGGLNVHALAALVREGRSVVEQPEAQRITPDALVALDCDIWIPAAQPGVMTADNAETVRARLVIEASNLPVTPAAAAILHRRGVLCLPDFIANAGAVIGAAMELRGATRSAAFDVIRDTITENTHAVLGGARRERRAPRDVATALAIGRLEKGMALRRWSVFAGLGAPGVDSRDPSAPVQR
jgi:glutamate dehydrogenase (NAD(P)+)